MNSDIWKQQKQKETSVFNVQKHLFFFTVAYSQKVSSGKTDVKRRKQTFPTAS